MEDKQSSPYLYAPINVPNFRRAVCIQTMKRLIQIVIVVLTLWNTIKQTEISSKQSDLDGQYSKYTVTILDQQKLLNDFIFNFKPDLHNFGEIEQKIQRLQTISDFFFNSTTTQNEKLNSQTSLLEIQQNKNNQLNSTIIDLIKKINDFDSLFDILSQKTDLINDNMIIVNLKLSDESEQSQYSKIDKINANIVVINSKISDMTVQSDSLSQSNQYKIDKLNTNMNLLNEKISDMSVQSDTVTRNQSQKIDKINTSINILNEKVSDITLSSDSAVQNQQLKIDKINTIITLLNQKMSDLTVLNDSNVQSQQQKIDKINTNIAITNSKISDITVLNDIATQNELTKIDKISTSIALLNQRINDITVQSNYNTQNNQNSQSTKKISITSFSSLDWETPFPTIYHQENNFKTIADITITKESIVTLTVNFQIWSGNCNYFIYFTRDGQPFEIKDVNNQLFNISSYQGESNSYLAIYYSRDLILSETKIYKFGVAFYQYGGSSSDTKIRGFTITAKVEEL